MNFTENDVLAVQADAFERARQLVLLLLSRKPIVTAFDVQAIGNPYDGRNGFDRADQSAPEPGATTLMFDGSEVMGTPVRGAPRPYECSRSNPCGNCAVCWD
jgi:hypothetical protein